MNEFYNKISEMIDSSLKLSETYFQEGKFQDQMIEIVKVHTLQMVLKIYLDLKNIK